MNIGILFSGGDGPGMNNCLYNLYKNLYKDNNIILFGEGFKGLINNTQIQFDLRQLKSNANKGGICIKSSRCPEFATKEGVQKGIKTYEQNKLDVLIVMGGNGSLRGAHELAEEGKNIMFIPCSIDNDIADCDYSIGFTTACQNCIEYIKNVHDTMRTFSRACIYEVMGRDCDKIAKFVGESVGADYIYGNKDCSCIECAKAIKNSTPIIVLRENILDIKEFAEEFEKLTDIETRYCVIGYYQRGGEPTDEEIIFSGVIADNCCNLIKQKIFNKQILLKDINGVYTPIVKDI